MFHIAARRALAGVLATLLVATIVPTTASADDTLPPVVTVPASFTLEATGPLTAVTFTASAMDDVDGDVPVTCVPASGSDFALGTTTVTCDASDAALNVGSASFDVTIVDTTAPTLSVPASMVVDATSGSGAPVTYAAPTATDIVDVTVTPVCSHASGDTFPLGLTSVTCTATDAAGNVAEASFIIRVVRSLHLTIAMDQANVPMASALQDHMTGTGMLEWSYGVRPAGVTVAISITKIDWFLNVACNVAASGTTDATGVFHFTVNPVACNTAGDYRVAAQTRFEGADASGATTYTIELL